MTAQEQRIADPEQWRTLMALPDAMLLEAWKTARDATRLARSQNQGVHSAMMWESLIEGAAASRFGVKRCHEVYRANYPDAAPT